MSDDGKQMAVPKGVSVALIVSLCVNLLVVGALAMMFWRWSPFSAMPPPPPPPRAGADFAADLGPDRGPDRRVDAGRGFGRGQGQKVGLGQGVLNPHILAKVAPAKADAIRAIIRSHRPKLAALRDAAFAARRDAAGVLAGETYSKAAFDRALERVRAADTALEGEVLDTVSECAGLLSPEERQAASRFRGGGGHGHGRWRQQP